MQAEAGPPGKAVGESSGDPLAAAAEVKSYLALWLGPDAPIANELILSLERRRRQIGFVDGLKTDRRADPASAERDLAERIAMTEELLDRVLVEGLRHRVGYRLGHADRVIFGELMKLGASGRLSGVAVCRDCIRVFVPSRKSTAERCDACHRHPAPAWEDNGVEGFAYPSMRFDKDPHEHGDDANFIGWTKVQFARCRECDQQFETSRKDAATCGGACRQARHKRRAAGDSSDLSPEARRSMEDREKMRAVVRQINRAAEGHADASDEILRLLAG